MKTLLWRRITLIALISTGLTFSVFGSGRSVFAQETPSSVRRVSVPVATGQSAASPVLIELSPGYGVNINLHLAPRKIDGTLSLSVKPKALYLARKAKENNVALSHIFLVCTDLYG